MGLERSGANQMPAVVQLLWLLWWYLAVDYEHLLTFPNHWAPINAQCLDASSTIAVTLRTLLHASQDTSCRTQPYHGALALYSGPWPHPCNKGSVYGQNGTHDMQNFFVQGSGHCTLSLAPQHPHNSECTCRYFYIATHVTTVSHLYHIGVCLANGT